MQGTLVITILAVQSSYRREVEEPLNDDAVVPDTIQWWIAPSGSWRIRTYALDHDIHTYLVGDVDGLADLALATAQKHYGDVIQSQHVIELRDCLDADEMSAAFRKAGLEPRLEVAAGRFAFWKPDKGKYQTQSSPN